MNFPDLVRNYGWLAVAVGTFFEGEWVMLAAGAGMRAGWLSPSALVEAGVGGALAGDLVRYWGGRFAGRALVRRWPALRPRLRPIERIIEHQSVLLIVHYQFIPRLCAGAPLGYGMSRMSAFRFFAVACAKIALFTAAFAGVGYGCASLVMWGRAAWVAVPAAAVVAVAVWTWWRTPVSGAFPEESPACSGEPATVRCASNRG